jgi:hypothetical protein
MRSRFRSLAFLALGSLVCACSSGSDGDPSITLAATDAASQEIVSFVVELEGVALRRASGEVLQLLPEPIPVDFATLTDLSRVLNLTSVPAGRYVEASITLDLTGASVYLLGQTTPAAVLDGDGLPFSGPITLPIQIGGALRAANGRNHLLELDFDLDQSVVVDLGANEVRVEPTLVIRVDRSDPKELALGGELRGVELNRRRFRIALESPGPNPSLLIAIEIDGNTVFQIDGVPSRGMAGLSALAALPLNSWVQAFGSADPSSSEIDAFTVEAGSGSYNGGTDIVEGHVIGRTGGAGADPTLLVLGHSNNASHTVFQFNQTFTVSADFTDTKVVRRGSFQVFDTDDVNVGQRVRVFGALGGLTLDARLPTDVIRLQPTRVKGFAADAPQAGTLVIDLTRVDLRLDTAFTWSEGGSTPPDPDALELDVGNLGNGLGIVAGTPVEALGFFTPVDDAGEDLEAATLVNRERETSLLAIHDRTDGFTVATTVLPTELEFVITGAAGAGEFALVDQGFLGAMPLPASPAPTVVPANPLRLGYYALRDRVTGTATVYLDFSEFAQALDQALGQGAVLFNFGATGTYDATANALAANVIGCVLD